MSNFYVGTIFLYLEMHLYEVRPRGDKRGVDLISDVLPFDGLRYGEPDAISNATNLFPSPRCALATKIGRPRESTAETQCANRRSKFHKCGQPFICTHNEAPIRIAMRVSNEDCSPHSSRVFAHEAI